RDDTRQAFLASPIYHTHSTARDLVQNFIVVQLKLTEIRSPDWERPRSRRGFQSRTRTRWTRRRIARGRIQTDRFLRRGHERDLGIGDLNNPLLGDRDSLGDETHWRMLVIENENLVSAAQIEEERTG